MPWDYSNLVAIHYPKGGRVFVFYDQKPGCPGFRYTGCYCDDGEEYAGAVLDKLGKRLAPTWRPEESGKQLELL